MEKRIYKPIMQALREAREDDPTLTESDGMMACYDVENMGFCKDGVTKWYQFRDINGVPCYTLKY